MTRYGGRNESPLREHLLNPTTGLVAGRSGPSFSVAQRGAHRERSLTDPTGRSYRTGHLLNPTVGNVRGMAANGGL